MEYGGLVQQSLVCLGQELQWERSKEVNFTCVYFAKIQRKKRWWREKGETVLHSRGCIPVPSTPGLQSSAGKLVCSIRGSALACLSLSSTQAPSTA